MRGKMKRLHKVHGESAVGNIKKKMEVFSRM